MAHMHAPVIRQVPPSEILPGIARTVKLSPLALASGVGWVIGTAWAIIVAGVSGIGWVIGTVVLMLKTLGFATYYGFLKGAHIKLVTKEEAAQMQQRRPSMPQ